MSVVDLLNAPWAILPDTLKQMNAIYQAHLRGERVDLGAYTPKGPADASSPDYSVTDGVAVISMDGVISKRMSLFSDICGGVSTEQLQQTLAAALADPQVKSIILSIDSPGGNVDGVQAAANAVYAARSQKPLAAYVDGQMCSAAYWIGSAASKVYIGADTDIVGSIGVVTQHVDTSKAEYMRGVQITDITAGKYKRIASQHAPLTQEARDTIQDQLDEVYSAFVDSVARFRGVNADAVENKMADGRVFVGKQAVKAGLADGEMTLAQLIGTMAKQPGGGRVSVSPITKGNAMAAASETNVVTAEEFEAAKKKAYEEGKTAGVAEGKSAGAAVERARIQAVENAGMPGHEDLIAKLKFDGKTSGPEAALQVVQAEKALQAKNLEALHADGAPVVPASVPDPATEAKNLAKAEKEHAEAADAKAKAASNPKAVGMKARDLVAKAKAEGRRMSYAEAVNEVINATK